MIMDVLKSLLSSKKFLATITGVIVTLVAKIGWDVPEETITKIVGLIASYVVGQGIADHGKEAAVVKAADDRAARSGGFIDARLLIGIVVVALLVVPIAGCGTTAAGARAAQGAMEPYAFHVVGQADGQVVFNARYLAVDARVTALVQFTHDGVVRWERYFEKEAGQRAYEVVFSDDGPRIVEVEFAIALAALRPQNIPVPD